MDTSQPSLLRLQQAPIPAGAPGAPARLATGIVSPALVGTVGGVAALCAGAPAAAAAAPGRAVGRTWADVGADVDSQMVRNFTFDVPVRLESETLEKIQGKLFARATPDKDTAVPLQSRIYIKANRKENEWGEIGVTSVDVCMRKMNLKSTTILKILDDHHIPCNEDSFFALSDVSTANQAARKALALRPGSIISVGTPPNETIADAMAIAEANAQNASYWEAKAGKLNARITVLLQASQEAQAALAAKDKELQTVLGKRKTPEQQTLEAELEAARAKIQRAKEGKRACRDETSKLLDENSKLRDENTKLRDENSKLRDHIGKLCEDLLAAFTRHASEVEALRAGFDDRVKAATERHASEVEALRAGFDDRVKAATDDAAKLREDLLAASTHHASEVEALRAGFDDRVKAATDDAAKLREDLLAASTHHASETEALRASLDDRVKTATHDARADLLRERRLLDAARAETDAQRKKRRETVSRLRKASRRLGRVCRALSGTDLQLRAAVVVASRDIADITEDRVQREWDALQDEE